MLILWKHFFSKYPLYRVKNLYCNFVLNHNIHKTASIHADVYLTVTDGLQIGRFSTINRKCLLDSRGGLSIGQYVSVSPDVHFITASHDINSSEFVLTLGSIEVGDYSWIGSRATILPGVTIGKGAVVAAGAVVTRDVGEFEVVAGIPAKCIGRRNCKPAYNPMWRPNYS
ncbi:DapH/DapD/GlmU-related protein [Thalassolituus sp.]|jgi:maltose O-acetyltransferase|uniref:acyltransferase n=1 Tax=Thalassolituus sp. TaxID=2030822 RepID=UPI0035147DD1